MNYREEAYKMRNLSKSLLDIIGVGDGASAPPPLSLSLSLDQVVKNIFGMDIDGKTIVPLPNTYILSFAPDDSCHVLPRLGINLQQSLGLENIFSLNFFPEYVHSYYCSLWLDTMKLLVV
jgi:hypothetical protein